MLKQTDNKQWKTNQQDIFISKIQKLKRFMKFWSWKHHYLKDVKKESLNLHFLELFTKFYIFNEKGIYLNITLQKYFANLYSFHQKKFFHYVF